MIIICRSVNVDPVSINCGFLSKDGTRCNLYTAGRVSKPAVKSIIPVSRVSGQSIQCFVRPGLHGRLGDCTAIFIENNYVGFGGDGTIGLRFIRDWSMSADTSLLPEVIRLYNKTNYPVTPRQKRSRCRSNRGIIDSPTPLFTPFCRFRYRSRGQTHSHQYPRTSSTNDPFLKWFSYTSRMMRIAMSTSPF